jgi:hypothetical protein
MIAADVVYPIAGLVVLVVPGLALLFAAGVRDKLWLAGAAVPISVGVCVLAGLGSGIPGLAYTPLLVLAVTLLLAVAIGTARRRWAAATAELAAEVAAPPAFLGALPPRLALPARIAGGLLCLIAAVLALQPWRSGLGGWDTYPQEHDTIIHTVLVGYIQHTGHAAPWQLLPLDLLTGQPVSFYPAGLPLAAAAAGQLAGGPIVGFNVVLALCTGPAFALGSAALAAAVLRRVHAGAEWTALAGGIAAVVAAGLYRPGINLLHDGGIAPNAVAMSLTPGVIAAVVTIGRRQWARAVLLGLALAGLFCVHPSVVATAGASIVVFWVVAALSRHGRRLLREQWPVLLVAAVVAVVAALAQLLGSVGQASRTGNWLPDIGAASLGDALRNNLLLTYGGYYDPKQAFAQVTAAGLALLGVAAVLATRLAWGALAMWLFWVVVSVDFKTSPFTGFGAGVGSFFYKSYVRVQAHVSLFVPLLAAIGLLFAAAGTARLLSHLRGLPWLRAGAPVTAVLVLLGLAGYGVTASIPYEHRNAQVLASRYAKPDFVRVGEDDRRAADWLRAHVRPGERVMNSANDGSTVAYVEDGVPIVNVVTLGAREAPYTFHLLKSFRDYPKDPAVRRLVLDLNISYVYVDAQAPGMGAGPGSPEHWYPQPVFTLAPGLRDLAALPGMSEVWRSGTVRLYHLDHRVLADMRP